MSAKDLINPNHDLSNPDLDLNNFSDKDLYHLCQRYGNGIKILRRIFAVLLVEVNRRRLHRKYGFEGIYEFAAKVGGMNKMLVNRILWLAVALKDKPFLWRAFKTEGCSKVRVVASVATKETDELWAEKVRNLSKPALEVLVQAWRKQNEEKQKKNCEENFNGNLFDLIGSVGIVDDQSDIYNINPAADSVPKNATENLNLASSKPETAGALNFGDTSASDGNKFIKMKFKVSRETEFKFLLFKQKLCKKRKEAMTSGEVLAILLEMTEEKTKQ